MAKQIFIKNENGNSNTPIYSLIGCRGRRMQVFDNKCIISTKPGIGSLITENATDGAKTIYYTDVIGIQFKKPGFTIGYLQLETASVNMNNLQCNFFNENSFTFEKNLYNHIDEVVDYISKKVEDAKQQKNSPILVANTVSSADELKKFKELLDMGVITQEEFNLKKSELLNIPTTDAHINTTTNLEIEAENKRREEEALRIEEERKINEAKKAEKEAKQLRLENERREAELRRIEIEKQTAEKKAALEKLKQEKAENERLKKEKELAEKAIYQAAIDEKDKKNKGILKHLSVTTLIIFAVVFVANIIASIISSDNIYSNIVFFILMFLLLSGIPTVLSLLAIKTSYGISGAKKLLKLFGNVFSFAESVLFLILGIVMLATAEFSFGFAFLGVAATCIANIVFIRKMKKI